MPVEPYREAAGEEYADASHLNTRTLLQERFRTHPEPWLDWLFDRLQLPQDGWVLDLGSGSGMLWARHLADVAPACQIFLCDQSRGILSEARATLGRDSGIGLAAADAQAIPLPDGSVKVVLASGLFDYLPDPRQAYQEVRRVLRAGGRLVAATGGRHHLQELEHLVGRFVPDADYGGDAEAFGLENGKSQLAPWFADITLDRYEDVLVFRSAEPLLAYILSEEAVSSRLSGEAVAELKQLIELKLAAEGEFKVRQQKGVFLATRP